MAALSYPRYRTAVAAWCGVSVFSLLTFTFGSSRAATIRVPADYPTIPDAIAAAAPGDSILIAPGTYNVDNLLIDKPLTLEGEAGAGTTILDGQSVHQLMTISNTTVGLLGLTLRRGVGIAIRVVGGLQMQDCVLEDNNGLAGVSGGWLTMVRCEARGHVGVPGAVYVGGGAWFDAVDCQFTNNGTVVMGYSTLTRCDLSGNGYGIYNGGGRIDDCSLTDNGVAVRSDNDGGVEMYRSTVTGNGTAISVLGNTGAVLEECLVANNGIGFSLSGGWCESAGEAWVSRSTIAMNGTNFFMDDAYCQFGSDHSEAHLDQSIVAFPTGGKQFDGPACVEAYLSCSLLFPLDDPPCFVDLGNNVVADPLFCDAAGGDFRVHADSPALAQACGIMGFAAESCGTSAVGDRPIAGIVPLRPYLGGPRPNPFNPATRLSVGVTEAGPVSVRVYEVSGRQVRVLADEPMEPGVREVVWDGKNEQGQPVASGQYLVRMETRGYTGVEKLTLLE